MDKVRKSDIRVGISGWRYVPWRGSFYPRSLRQNHELHFASRCVNSIEINGSFYALQTPERYETWYADAPDDFIFCVKAPRYITHIKRLRDVEKPIANFFASGILQLGKKLGPILWQFPPTFTFDIEVFRQFLELLPTNTKEAQECANHCDPELKKTNQKIIPQQKIRHAIEIRNESFNNENFIALLRKFNVALVIADTGGRWPEMEDITSDFIYMRLHGNSELYKSGYSEAALKHWYERIKTWSQGDEPKDAKHIAGDHLAPTTSRDIFCYFDNTEKLWAPYDARKILTKFDLDKYLEMEPGVMPQSLLPKPRSSSKVSSSKPNS